MKQVPSENNLLDCNKNLQLVKKAVKKNLGVSLPFLSDIAHHMVTPHNNETRSLVLLQSASLFDDPDDDIIDIGSTLEYLHTASALHQNIKEPEKARRHLQQVQKLWGSEAGILLGDYLLSISFQILVKVGNLDVLECVSLATQNIARGQVLEVSEPPLTATLKHWRSVTRDKIAGLFGAGAQSAAYWGKSSEATASTLFDFGMHVGMAVQLKTELAAVEDEKFFQQKLKKQDLWSPLCFLLHDCMPPNELKELSDKLLNEFDVPEMFTKLGYLFKKYKVSEKVHYEAEVELREAKECLERLELDSAPLQPLTQYSMI